MSKRLALYVNMNEPFKTIGLSNDPVKANVQIAAELRVYIDDGYKSFTSDDYPQCWLFTRDDDKWVLLVVEDVLPAPLVITGSYAVSRPSLPMMWKRLSPVVQNGV